MRDWLRYELFRGRLRESERQASERSLTVLSELAFTPDHFNRVDQGQSGDLSCSSKCRLMYGGTLPR